jgi:hypothetical protein
MNYESDRDEALTYLQSEPDVGILQMEYDRARLDQDEYVMACERAYNDRRNIWPGKSLDMRKKGANAFPWDGASDMEVNVIGERIDTYVSLLTQALDRSHIKAFPTSHTSLAKASVVSMFLKWMRKSYIPDFKKQMELGANHLLEKGIMISYVGWKREKRTFKQTVTLEELQAQLPELLEILLGEDVAAAEAMVKDAFPDMGMGRVKKAVRELRMNGITEVSIPRMSVDCPITLSCEPDGEVVFPSYVTDPQRSPYVFWRTFYTPQELEKKVVSEGWDKKWVKEAIEKLKGKDNYSYETASERAQRRDLGEDDDRVMIIYAYQRLIDEEDGSEGIYCTVFNPTADGYAKNELLNGYDDYPFVVTRLNDNQKRMYETTSFSDILRGPQWQVKTERDSRIDRASMATLPPLFHPAGHPPKDWGPGRRLPYRRLGEIAYGPIPQFDPGSERIEAQMISQADKAVGLDIENPLSALRQQFYVNKFLDHVKDVLALAFKLYQRMGPDEVFFQVTGSPDPQVMSKGDADDNFSIMVSFDTRETDPEAVESQMKNMATLMQIDRNGRINVDKLLELLAAQVNPFLADHVLQPAEEAQDKMLKDVSDDLTKIFSGIEVPARPNGADFAMQLIQSYAQQPDIMQRLQNDEAFAARIEKYVGQYRMMQMQAQNAVTGRLGTESAKVGNIDTQSMAQ